MRSDGCGSQRREESSFDAIAHGNEHLSLAMLMAMGHVAHTMPLEGGIRYKKKKKRASEVCFGAGLGADLPPTSREIPKEHLNTTQQHVAVSLTILEIIVA